MIAASPATTPLPAQVSVQNVELRIQPGRERLRPYETAAIQVRAYGRANSRRVRLLEAGAVFRVLERDGGWLSKPFHYDWPDDEPIFVQDKGAPADRRITTVTGAFLLQDTVLYTAPSKTGRYTVEARTRDHRARVEIEVSPSAPPLRSAESTSFGAESQPRDFYRDLAEHYAPLVCQETWFEPKADFLARFDYDGDWRGDNNWDNLLSGSSQAYVYYAAMETATHYFLVYNFFHPRRYSDNCINGACHENDNGGLILTVRKDGSKYGRPELMETLAHNITYAYTFDRRIRDGAHAIHGALQLWQDSHPAVFIESGPHGVFSAADAKHSRFSLESMDFTGSTGVSYRYGGAAARPAHANDREVSYELLSITEHWWPRAISRSGYESRTFDDYFRYTPLGNRPGAAAEEIAGSFLGRKGSPNAAKPFWAWEDSPLVKRRALATGQWGLDPAYAVSASLKFPVGTPFSLDYVYNPYLEGGSRLSAVTAVPIPRSNKPGDRAAFAQAPAARPPGGDRHLLSAPAERPNYKLKDKQGQLEFRARVDGGVYLYIHGDQIEVEYLSGRPMDEIRYRFSQPLPAADMDEVKLESVDGRGPVRLIEWPNPGNQFTAKMRIQDDKAGAAMYKFKLVWRR